MVELFAQLALIDHLGEADVFGAVDEGKGDLRLRFVAKHGLAHEQFVEIRVDHGAHDRVDFPGVVINAGCDIDHVGLLI